jgi:hypothetical protein
MKSRIAVIPLDDRPCNTRFPVEIARIAGCEARLPPRELLGWFTRPARCEDIAAWLRSLDLPLDALIVSIDMLAYGGLVASRTPATSLETAWARLSTLREWRRAHPRVPVYAFNVVRRLAPTLDRDEMVAHHRLLQEYAILKDQAARTGDARLAVELENVERELPPDVLQDYLASRARNHAINREMLHWLADDVFDFLLLPQEDCAEFGLHRIEQAALEKGSSSLRVTDRVAIHPGADEAALTLLARHWNRMAARPMSFHIIYSNPNDAHRIPPFEDMPLSESVPRHIAAAGGVQATESDADVLLFITSPAPFGRDSLTAEVRAQRAQAFRPFVDRIATALAQARRVAVADVAFANGADPAFVAALGERAVFSRLLAFAAWNTAGNTLGTVLAQCVANACPSPRLNAQFVFARFVDDWGYQALTRPDVERQARAINASLLQLGDAWKFCEDITRSALQRLADNLRGKHFSDYKLTRCDVMLPWGRTFEVDVDVEFNDQ